MLEIDDKCEFTTTADQVELRTKTNGDLVIIRGVHLTPEQAASLAYLVNKGAASTLKIEITEEGT